jgi:hypothetical protein
MIRVSFRVPIPVSTGERPLEVMERVRLFIVSCGADTTLDPRLAAQRETAVANVAGTTFMAHNQPSR